MFEKIILWMAAGLAFFAVLYLLHRLGMWAEKKGWLYYTEFRRGSVSQAVIQEVDLTINPQVRYTIEAKRHVREGVIIKAGGNDENSKDK